MKNGQVEFLDALKLSFENEGLVKLQLSHYYGAETGLKKLIIKPVLVKNKRQLSFVSSYKTQDITKIHPLDIASTKLSELIDFKQFRKAHLFTKTVDYLLKVRMHTFKLKTQTATLTSLPSLAHDHQKNRKIQAKDKAYLHPLKITDKNGLVYKHAQDKYRQINHYIEILSRLLQKLPAQKMVNIVDMGAGKGYLTFALYDYLNHELGIPAKVVGIEFRKHLVDFCNSVASESHFSNLSFEEGTIAAYQAKFDIHVLIALHACDTATDEAIFKGLSAKADLIVVAPCCHHQIRTEIEQNKQKNELNFLLKHGIFMERQAEMVTDGLRALILEYHGYSTKVFEFISDAHTPKNVLIVGERKPNKAIDQAAILKKIKETKAYFGIGTHYLEQLLGW